MKIQTFKLIKISILVLFCSLFAIACSGSGFLANADSKEDKLWNGVVVGSEKAPLKLEVFQDLRCGMCKFWSKKVLPGLISDFVEEGKLQIVFKEYPLIPRDREMGLANAAKCAAEQNEYHNFVNEIYNNMKQAELSKIPQFAKDAGIDEMEEFTQCSNSKKYFNEIKEERAEAKKHGIPGTPSFLLNGEKIVGAKPYPIFKKLIEERL